MACLLSVVSAYFLSQLTYAGGCHIAGFLLLAYRKYNKLCATVDFCDCLSSHSITDAMFMRPGYVYSVLLQYGNELPKFLEYRQQDVQHSVSAQYTH